ncbi:uncharacterized protein METZ01_LOCUS478126, partial [marine metagenome]
MYRRTSLYCPDRILNILEHRGELHEGEKDVLNPFRKIGQAKISARYTLSFGTCIQDTPTPALVIG